MRTALVLIALLLLPQAASAEDPVAGGELTVIVEGLGSDEGQVMMALFDSEASFDGPAEPVRKAKLAIEKHAAAQTWSGLSPGNYALRVFHDRNDDGELDSNWMGMPKEPFGFSQNPKLRFGPPSFEQARFELGAEPLIVKVRLREM